MDAMQGIRVAVIGGTGVYSPDPLTDIEQREVTTPYGTVSLTVGWMGGSQVAFLPRHGAGHAIPPHRINYRANIWALWRLGVECVLATSAVGSMRQQLPPGDLVAIDQFIDFTKVRPVTFYDGDFDPFALERGEPKSVVHRVVHTDVTEPYDAGLRTLLGETAAAAGIPLTDGGCYVAAEGPRYETPAEIRAFAAWGGDVVGMTGVPEVTLAREAGLKYAGVSMVTNFAAGISQTPLSHQEVVHVVKQNGERVGRLVWGCVEQLVDRRTGGDRR